MPTLVIAAMHAQRSGNKDIRDSSDKINLKRSADVLHGAMSPNRQKPRECLKMGGWLWPCAWFAKRSVRARLTDGKNRTKPQGDHAMHTPLYVRGTEAFRHASNE